MVLDPIPQPLPVHFFGSRPQPPTSHLHTNKPTKPTSYSHATDRGGKGVLRQLLSTNNASRTGQTLTDTYTSTNLQNPILLPTKPTLAEKDDYFAICHLMLRVMKHMHTRTPTHQPNLPHLPLIPTKPTLTGKDSFIVICQSTLRVTQDMHTHTPHTPTKPTTPAPSSHKTHHT